MTRAGAQPGVAPDDIGDRRLAAGDLDGDGDTDVIAAAIDAAAAIVCGTTAATATARCACGSRRASATAARRREGGVRAGSLRQRLETSAATPAVAPADCCSASARATAPTSCACCGRRASCRPRRRRVDGPPYASTCIVTELDRKPSSCPYLYTWNGARFEFVTDFMGGGEMGTGRAGPCEPSRPDEYVRIRGDQLRARDGRLRAARDQRARGGAVRRSRCSWSPSITRPASTSIPNEGLRPPRAPFGCMRSRGAAPPLAARATSTATTCSTQLAALDRRVSGRLRAASRSAATRAAQR